jgi:hypothetical protein
MNQRHFILLLTCIFVFHFTSSAQQEKTAEKNKQEAYYYLVNSADTTKRIKIRSSEKFSVEIQEPYSDSTIRSIKSSTTGSIRTMEDSTMTMKIYHYRTTTYYKNDSSITAENRYGANNPHVTYGGALKNIDLRYISSITYSSQTKSDANGIFGAIIYVSAQNLLLVAPLVSIKYNTWEFNSERYFQWAAVNLALLAASVPLAMATLDKTYKITRKGAKKDKEYWYFESVK